MELNYNEIGSRIRRLRKQKKMSQEMLAEKADLSIVHISHIETANTKVSLPALVSIAIALDVTPDTLLVDSLPQAESTLQKEISSLLTDCSSYELSVITDIVSSTLTTLRKNQWRINH